MSTDQNTKSTRTTNMASAIQVDFTEARQETFWHRHLPFEVKWKVERGHTDPIVVLVKTLDGLQAKYAPGKWDKLVAHGEGVWRVRLDNMQQLETLESWCQWMKPLPRTPYSAY